MKQRLLLLTAFMAMTLTAGLMAACDNDDDERFVTCPVEPGLIDTWQFVERLNGIPDTPQPEAHTLTFTEDGTAAFTYDDGTTNKLHFDYAENQKDYDSPYLVITIADKSIDGATETPFGVEINGNQLKLHYLGIYTTDHIPETYVYRRLK